jgi:hypothetical protein
MTSAGSGLEERGEPDHCLEQVLPMAKGKWLKNVLKTLHGVQVDLCGLDRQPCTPICQKEKQLFASVISVAMVPQPCAMSVI